MGHRLWNCPVPIHTPEYSATPYVCPAENYGISGDPMENWARLIRSSAWLIAELVCLLVWFISNPVEWPNSSGMYSGQ